MNKSLKLLKYIFFEYKIFGCNHSVCDIVKEEKKDYIKTSDCGEFETWNHITTCKCSHAYEINRLVTTDKFWRGWRS